MVLGSHSRLIGDDYCHLVTGLEFGPWENVLWWRNSLNGSYSYYFLHGLTAPLEARAPAVFVFTIVITWLLGLVWLINAGGSLLSRARLPWARVFTLAAALVSLSIYALLSSRSIYYYSAASRHSLPTAVLMILLAAGCSSVPRIHSPNRLAAASASFALAAFVIAGMSEVFAVMQLVIFASLLPIVYVLSSGAIRRKILALNISGLAATIAALLVMVTAPGIARRLRLIDEKQGLPPLDPAAFLPKILDSIQPVIKDIGLVTGFIGMFALGLFLLLTLKNLAQPSPICKPFRLAWPPLLICLLAQILLLPLVWANLSDNPQIFSRFSPGYAVVVAVQLLFIVSLAAILAARQRINYLLLAKPKYWPAIPALTLFATIFLFGLSQFRSINWRAATYVACSIYILVFALLWQFHFHFRTTGIKSHGLPAVIWVFLAKWLCVLALLVMNLAINGTLYTYSLSMVSFAFVLSGFVCGVALATAIRQVNAEIPAARATRLLVDVSALVAVAIGFAILLGNVRSFPQFERYSRAWDERHQMILSKRDAGDRLAELPLLAQDILNVPGGYISHDYWQSSCASDEVTKLIEKRYRA